MKLLEHITFVDTPGVLSGEKQRTQRSYDFTGVTSWFAAKCDLILLLFDPHKLDISDEFKRVISSLRGHDDKIRVVLNKADQVDTQQVMALVAINLFCLLCLCFVYFVGNTVPYDEHLFPLIHATAYESVWCIDVVSWKSAKYSRGCACVYWVISYCYSLLLYPSL